VGLPSLSASNFLANCHWSRRKKDDETKQVPHSSDFPFRGQTDSHRGFRAETGTLWGSTAKNSLRPQVGAGISASAINSLRPALLPDTGNNEYEKPRSRGLPPECATKPGRNAEPKSNCNECCHLQNLVKVEAGVRGLQIDPRFSANRFYGVCSICQDDTPSTCR